AVKESLAGSCCAINNAALDRHWDCMKLNLLAALLLVRVTLSAADAPYPRSPLIAGITWHWETLTTGAPGSDLWPVTWGPDDHLYAAWGDGGGFGGSDSDGRVAMGFA